MSIDGEVVVGCREVAGRRVEGRDGEDFGRLDSVRNENPRQASKIVWPAKIWRIEVGAGASDWPDCSLAFHRPRICRRLSSSPHLQDLSFGNFQHSNNRGCLLHLSSFRQVQIAATDAERTSHHGLEIVQMMPPGISAAAPIATTTDSRLINSSCKALLHISHGKIAILSFIPFPPTSPYDETIIAFWHLL